MSELTDYSTKVRKNFFILKERPDENCERIRIIDFNKYFSLEDIKRDKLKINDLQTLFVPVNGTYFPDYFTENGLDFISIKFMLYLESKLDLRQMQYCHVGFIADKKRVEEYILIIPEKLDCIIEGSLCFSKAGIPEYFEIDDYKTGLLEIFRIKDIPYIIVTEKLDRIEYSGFECTSIENFFGYENVRDKVYQERLRGVILEDRLNEFRKAAGEQGKYDLARKTEEMIRKNDIGKEIYTVLKALFDGYRGKKFSGEILSDRFLLFFFSLESGTLEISEEIKGFHQNQYYLKSIKSIGELLDQMPETLKDYARNLFKEKVLLSAALECKIFDHYQQLHQDTRFRIYIQEEYFKSMNPPMVYDYKCCFQKEVEAYQNITLPNAEKPFCFMPYKSVTVQKTNTLDLSNRDLREYNFTGKDLKGITIRNSNLRRAIFNDCMLTGSQFIDCDLTGAQFLKSCLRDAKFTVTEINNTNFSYADMKGIDISDSDLYCSTFVKSDLSCAKITNSIIQEAYFYNSRLMDATFNVSQYFHYNSFIMCDLRGSRLIGNIMDIENGIVKCDFRNSDMNGCKIEFKCIENTAFIKAKLNNASFSKSKIISNCDFRWSSLKGTDLAEVILRENDFSFVDLSTLKAMKGNLFSSNNFTYTNLSGYDFSLGGLSSSNNFVYTDLSNSILCNSTLEKSNLIFPNLSGASLNGAVLHEDQLKFLKLSERQKGDLEIILADGQ
ncbi:pentapeptide repeat-containing protein [Pseudobacteroides cellulosolvens]|uniref:Pentapeptide repeat protein n=1 Tax=Pseudobacteroides cellulosolvens ATCC 35603 = DSM 2933 TaxID=398512 RepID=A0A0L6JX94_9FIRM|nr:pentapeptide repeat-containing protein [Pseudobacteroides cellulosolvens]KNY30067.1 hypothetical protein Bccel_5344 [Pseudobacteroides cellulosolvens ATCC 35603 = DSM 2933]